MRKFKKILLRISTLVISALSITLLASCSLSGNKIYFGNFQSYMSPDVINQVSRQHNAEFKSYKNNEALLREFKNNYDIAVSSSYTVMELIKRDELEKIRWSDLNIIFGGMQIKNSKEALNLFTPEIHPILLGYDFDGDGVKDNLLDYAIPYFLQDFILGYKTEKLKFTNPNTFNNWQEVLVELQKLINDPNATNIPRGISIDDPRTIYSLGKLVQDPNNNVNPLLNENSIKDFKKVFSFLNEFFKNNQMIFNSDSGNVLNDLAHPNGSSFGFMYNGDVIYSMFGGDDPKNVKVDFVRPTTGSNLALDMIVINKNSVANRTNIYKMIGDIALNGITEKVIDEKSLAFSNFKFVMYTSPVKALYDYASDPTGYFSSLTNDPSLIERAIAAFKIPSTDSLNKIEDKITNLQKSNMLIAYLFTKNSL